VSGGSLIGAVSFGSYALASVKCACIVVPLLVPSPVAKISGIVERMRRTPASIRYEELHRVCVAYFGEPRQSGTSHAIFKTPWPGDPRVNIQNARGKAKPYQVRQVLLAIDRREGVGKSEGEETREGSK